MDIYKVSYGKTHKEHYQKVLLKPFDGKEALMNERKAFTYQVEIYPEILIRVILCILNSFLKHHLICVAYFPIFTL